MFDHSMIKTKDILVVWVEVLPLPTNEAIVMADAPHIVLHGDITECTGKNIGYSFTNDDSMIETKNVYKDLNGIYVELLHTFRSHDECN